MEHQEYGGRVTEPFDFRDDPEDFQLELNPCSTEPSIVSPFPNDIIMDYSSEFTTHHYFESKEKLINWVRAIAQEHGSVIVVKRSDFNIKYKPRIMLACERSGSYRAPKPKFMVDEADFEEKKKSKRITGTKKCSCPFLLEGKEVSPNEWELTVACGVHNHPVAQDLTGHPYVSRFRKEEEEFVLGLCQGNSRPKDILYQVKQTFKDNKSTIRTLYNFRASHGVIERGGKSQMKYLMSKVTEHEYICYTRRCPNTDTVKEIFFAHPTSVKLLCSFPGVLLMDCTYKTNRYKFPLLEIVGVTSTDMTFQVACAYLEREQEDNYVWALSMLRSLMNQSHLPHVIITDRELTLMNAVEACFPTTHPLLCRWHISMNIVAKCKKMFRTKEKWESFIYSWNVLVLADFESSFGEYVRRLQVDFSDYGGAVEYVMSQWIEPYKERFVSAWTNNVMHFKNSTTNRAEIQRSVLKKHLGSSMGNFETCWGRIHTLLEMSHTEIRASFEVSINVVQHRFKLNVFKDLRGVVSIDGMSKIHEELKTVPPGCLDPSECGCVLRRTCGLPCAHELFEFVRDGRPVPLEQVDSFWRKLDMEPVADVDDAVIADLGCHLNDAWDNVKTRFESSGEAGKRALLRGLRELANPVTTPLLAPEGHAATRGRPSVKRGKKMDQSTKRDPSGFEYATSFDDSSTPVWVSGSQQSGNVALFSTRMPSKQAPRALSPYEVLMGCVLADIDVKADGHCGFRAIAHHVRGNEDSYSVVRDDLIHELRSNYQIYAHAYGETSLSKLDSRLFCNEDFAPVFNWFALPDMGTLVANQYKVVFVNKGSSSSL